MSSRCVDAKPVDGVPSPSTAQCLLGGGWKPLAAGRALNYTDLLVRSRVFRTIAESQAVVRACELYNRAGLDIEQLRWHGQGCTGALTSAMTGSFSGVFNRTTRPVQLFVLSDSVGAQINGMLETAARVNPHLQQLTVIAMRRNNVGGMPVIPRSVEGCRQLLDFIKWKAQPGARQIVVARVPSEST